MKKIPGVCDRPWNGEWIDSALPVKAMEKLNRIQGMRMVATCAGHPVSSGWGNPNPWFRFSVPRNQVAKVHDILGGFAVVSQISGLITPTIKKHRIIGVLMDIQCPKSCEWVSRRWIDRWWSRCVDALQAASLS